MATLKVSIDPARIREADAVRLMAHHLSLAAAYFEATPDTAVQALAELPDVFEGNAMALGPARQWYLAMAKAYADGDVT